MTLTFTIPGLPRMANGGHGSWQRNAREKRKWKLAVAKELVGRSPSVPFKRVRVTLTRRSASEPDFDGLVHGFKPVIDALVFYGIVEDDKRANLDATYLWEKAPRGQGSIEVVVQSVLQE